MERIGTFKSLAVRDFSFQEGEMFSNRPEKIFLAVCKEPSLKTRNVVKITSETGKDLLVGNACLGFSSREGRDRDLGEVFWLVSNIKEDVLKTFSLWLRCSTKEKMDGILDFIQKNSSKKEHFIEKTVQIYERSSFELNEILETVSLGFQKIC